MSSSPDRPTPALLARLRVRVRLVGRAAAVGGVVGATVAAAFGPTGLAETAFALGALLFGFALIGWSGSVLVGGAVEHARRHLDLDTDWTEADSRRAMARIGGFGAGVMVGAAVLGTILG